MDHEVYGTLKIACASIVGQNWLPKVLKKFVQKYPHAKISLITGWSSEILKSLYDGQVHVGIIRGAPDWKGIKQHLFTDMLYLVDTEMQELDKYLKRIDHLFNLKVIPIIIKKFKIGGIVNFRQHPKSTIVVDQIETCKQMAV